MCHKKQKQIFQKKQRFCQFSFSLCCHVTQQLPRGIRAVWVVNEREEVWQRWWNAEVRSLPQPVGVLQNDLLMVQYGPFFLKICMILCCGVWQGCLYEFICTSHLCLVWQRSGEGIQSPRTGVRIVGELFDEIPENGTQILPKSSRVC